jgi:hypothetical protein
MRSFIISTLHLIQWSNQGDRWNIWQPWRKIKKIIISVGSAKLKGRDHFED